MRQIQVTGPKMRRPHLNHAQWCHIKRYRDLCAIRGVERWIGGLLKIFTASISRAGRLGWWRIDKWRQKKNRLKPTLPAPEIESIDDVLAGNLSAPSGDTLVVSLPPVSFVLFIFYFGRMIFFLSLSSRRVGGNSAAKGSRKPCAHHHWPTRGDRATLLPAPEHSLIALCGTTLRRPSTPPPHRVT